ncbi:metallophosphoesterase [Haloferula sp.]|uniref:metallophosphoesterase family protein n=1 Tax=Haloferula sp. TaxID=2497595 RepID=UPI003C743108
MMTMLLRLLLLFSLVVSARGVDHGPIVQWSENPDSKASIRWIERVGAAGREGKWVKGPGGFGYGDDDDTTVLRGMENNYQSVAIRRKFSLPDFLPKDATLYLAARYDDGFVAWLDGEEIVRKNVRIVDGKEQVINKHEARGVEETLLGKAADLIGSGEKILAVEGFNDGKTSSDFTLDIRLVGKSGGKTYVLIAEGDEWEYLAGEKPKAGWRRTTEATELSEEDRELVETMDYRIEGETEWKSATIERHPFAETAHRVGHVDLEGLPAASVIEFKHGDSSYRFRTAPKDGVDLRFVTGGDMFHERKLLDAMNARAGAEDPMFALLGGDLAYTNDSNPARWFIWFDSWAENARTPGGLMVPMVVAIGNHEIKGASYRPNDAPGPEMAKEFFSLFKMPETGQARQAIDIGDQFSLILLDSGHSATLASQSAWLEECLKERQGVKRLFVCYHRPAWGSGAKDDAVEIQEQWSPLFEEYQVDAVFENDHHVYARTHPVYEGKVDEIRGVPYLGSGAWGVKIRQVPLDAKEKRPWLAEAEALNHLYVIECNENGWTAVAKKARGTEFDRVERKWRR